MDNQLPGTEMTVGQPVQDTLFSLEELTLKSSYSIAELKKQIKDARAMVKDAYASSEMYSEQKSRLEGEKKQMQDIKKELDNKPDIASLLQTVKDLAAEIREKAVTVSDCALEYARMAGKDTIDKDGVTFDILKSAKLVKRKQ